MEESGEGLKDENELKDGSDWVLRQSRIWMTLNTDVTEHGSHINQPGRPPSKKEKKMLQLNRKAFCFFLKTMFLFMSNCHFRRI